MSIKVRAIERGYFGDKIREEGDEFTIDNEKQFSERWMEKAKKKATPKPGPEGDPDPETLSDLGKKDGLEKKGLKEKLAKALEDLKASTSGKLDVKKDDAKKADSQ